MSMAATELRFKLEEIELFYAYHKIRKMCPSLDSTSRTSDSQASKNRALIS